ncbi:DUF3883 domain-containing protein [Metabacillus herbersteinensis]|uniref:DUF3883 domain-containing protein n=1 Tax=Metabacillus herbersteinensis TaxID=283816 RepID=A0ABV6GDT6_9BACI
MIDQRNDKLLVMKNFIDHELKNIRHTYIQTPARIVSDYNNEVEKMKDYNGRQLLEMLQNADDESESAIDKTAYIELTDTHLIIANNGNPFSEGGVQSLLYSYLSPKSTQQNKIGHKGTGFRSVLSWANSIYIKSEGLSIEFSRANAITYLERLVDEHPEILHLLSSKTNEPHPIATLLTPQWNPNDYERFNLYDTYIVLSIKEEVKVDIQEQINNIEMEVLLFLQHLERIIIRSADRNIVITKKILVNGQVHIMLEEDGTIIREKTWKLRKRTGVYDNKNYEVKLAYSEELDDHNHLLYSFFKTNVRLPFPAVMHGTFELTGNRNHLTESPANAHVLDELIQLMIDTALEIADSSTIVSWDALKLLAFDENMDQNLINMKFDQKLIQKIKENKLFPVITGEYVSYKDKPVFYQNPYAEFLPVENFPGLTLYTDDENLLMLIGQLKLFRYDAKYMFSVLSKVSKQWKMEHRAKCIHYLLQDYKNRFEDEENRKLLRIFIDQHGEQVAADAELFLPPENRQLQVPSYVNIRFLHEGLYKALLKECNVPGARALAYTLAVFDVQEYNFESVLRKAVAQTRVFALNEKSKKKIYISELLTFLYNLYQTRKNNETFPSGVNVPLLNRFRKVINTSELYFGREYDGSITEQLLGPVDKGLFIGSPKTLGLEQHNELELKRFLSWIGVAEYPRFSKKRLREAEYERNLYQNIPYPITLEGEMFPYFDDLWSVKSGRSVMQVETVDRLDDILAKAPFASILIWLLKDPHARELIMEGKELDSGSHVNVPIQNKRNPRRLRADQMKSYFLWKLQTSRWIENVRGEKVDTHFCCLSKTFGSDFSPLIEVPAFDVYREPLSTANILAEEVEALLLKLGIGHDFRNLTTETIYRILLKLPDIDPQGTKARGIYKQIIMSKSKVDEKSPTYVRFMEEGKVLVNLKGEKTYCPVSEAFYVENRTFSEDIMNKFPVLDLERRSGNQLVRNLLGVQPLVGLRFKLTDQPEIHHLNEKFQLDLEAFKPFVYAYRLDKDNKHNELNRIKKLRISICTDIRASYVHLNQEYTFFIKDYEYIALEKGYHIYLKLPKDEHNHINDLRENFLFNEAIAEILAGVLRVEENRKDYRELFSKKTAQREELLRRELDDEQLSKLQKARTYLGITTDPTRNFWMAMLRAAKVNITALDFESEDTFIFSVAVAFKLDLEYLHQIWPKLDYEEPGSENSAPLLIPLLLVIGIDTADFNAYATIEADLTSYYRTELDRLKMEYSGIFLSLLYKRLITIEEQEQRRFIELRDRYAYFEDFKIHNSVNYDVHSMFATFLSEQFAIKLIKLEETKRIDLQSIYFSNEQTLFNELQKYNVTNAQFEDFVGKPEVGSLLYFDRVTDLVNDYLRSIKSANSSTSGETSSNTTSSSGAMEETSDGYSVLFKKVQQVSLDKRITTMRTSKIEKTPNGSSKRNGQNSRVSPNPNQAAKDKTGFLGEAHVYLALCKEYGKENVEWVSENARRAKVNEYGNDGEKHDLRYMNKRGQLKYVEVKSSTGHDMLFHISKEEVTFGELKKDAYEVFFVLNVYSEDCRIRRIPGLFKYAREESFNQNPRFNVENRNFVIRFQETERPNKN